MGVVVFLCVAPPPRVPLWPSYLVENWLKTHQIIIDCYLTLQTIGKVTQTKTAPNGAVFIYCN